MHIKPISFVSKSHLKNIAIPISTKNETTSFKNCVFFFFNKVNTVDEVAKANAHELPVMRHSCCIFNIIKLDTTNIGFDLWISPAMYCCFWSFYLSLF